MKNVIQQFKITHRPHRKPIEIGHVITHFGFERASMYCMRNNRRQDLSYL